MFVKIFFEDLFGVFDHGAELPDAELFTEAPGTIVAEEDRAFGGEFQGDGGGQENGGEGEKETAADEDIEDAFDESLEGMFERAMVTDAGESSAFDAFDPESGGFALVDDGYESREENMELLNEIGGATGFVIKDGAKDLFGIGDAVEILARLREGVMVLFG